MKLVAQRVQKAKVIKVEGGETVGEIGRGLFVLVGFKKGDSQEQAAALADKLAKLRVMSDDNDKMNLTVADAGGKFLVVSQFTLYADTTGGNRPSFIKAEEPEKAGKLYKFFVEKLKEKGVAVETGSFGDYMTIDAVLDGPVTILYD